MFYLIKLILTLLKAIQTIIIKKIIYLAKNFNFFLLNYYKVLK